MNNYKSIQKMLSKKGMNLVNDDIYDVISIWKSWYRGNVDDFHFYNAKLVDGSECRCERLTMNIPKKVCEDFSKLLWSEKAKITLDTESATNKLWSILDNKKNNFSISFPQAVEKAFALGTGVLIEYKVEDETIIEYIDGDNIAPYKFTNSYIYGFISVNNFIEANDKEKKQYYTHITYHEYVNGKYMKLNELYVSDTASSIGKEVSFEDKFPDVENPVVYITDTPHFQFIKPGIANNYDLSSPMGLSVYANQLDKFKALDTKYDSFMNEFELGKKRILVDKSLVKTSTVVTDGVVSNVSYFDKRDKVYQAISGMENLPAKEIDFSIRYEEHIQGINADLNYISAGVGLGQNYYDFNQDGVKTATEVVSENSDTFRTKAHHEIVIRDVLYDLVKSIMFLEDIESKNINIIFDDSIIQDEDAKIDKGLKLLSAGAISKETFMRDYLNYDEDKIIQELAKLKEQNKIVMPESIDFFGADTNQVGE